MTHTISIRTISIFAAIIGLLAIVLMTAHGNPAQGQSTPSVGSRNQLTSTGVTSQTTEPLPHQRQPDRPNSAKPPSQTVTVQYRTSDYHSQDCVNTRLHRSQRNTVLLAPAPPSEPSASRC